MFYTYIYRDPRPNKYNVPVYVGKGQDKTSRAEQHWDKPHECHNKRLRNLLLLLKREGLEPVIEIVFRTESEDEAFAKEKELIALFGRADLGKGTLFNSTDGGEGIANLDPEIIARRAATLKETMNTPKMRQKCSDHSLKLWNTPGHREKVTKSVIATVRTPEHSAKLSASISAARSTKESRAKTSAISATNWQNPEYREATLAAQKEGMSTKEAKENRGSATKAGWENPETRRKRTEGIRASKTPELRAQVSEKCKALWDDEARAIQSQRMKAACSTPEAKANRAAAAKEAWARRKNKAIINPQSPQPG